MKGSKTTIIPRSAVCDEESLNAQVFLNRHRYALLLAAQAIAFWPVWGWLGRRWVASPDERLCVIPAVVLGVFAVMGRRADRTAGVSPAVPVGVSPTGGAVRRASGLTENGVGETPTPTAGETPAGTGLGTVPSEGGRGLPAAARGLSTWGRVIPNRVGETPAGTFVPILLTLLYAAAFHFVPSLVRAGLAMLALSSTFGLGFFGRAIHPASMGLMLLSLPVVPTLQFYLGYPMRAAVAWAACPALRVSGFEVERSGACLVTAGRMVMVDAPCSGVKMLWAGLLLAGVLALAFRMTPWRTVWTAAAAVGLVLVGNLLRTCALFVADATDYHLPSWGHSGVGVLAFAAAGGALVWLARRWRRVSPCG